MKILIDCSGCCQDKIISVKVYDQDIIYEAQLTELQRYILSEICEEIGEVNGTNN